MNTRFTTTKVRQAAFCIVLLCSCCFAETYRVEFDSTWSLTNHPTAYDSNAHFSPLIGATHDASVSLWEMGGIATNGIERMAETGSTSALRTEISALGSAANVISGSGINAPGTTFFDFEVTEEASLVSLVTMIAPSPDWFVGVSNLDLREEEVWQRQVVVDLHAYDSGTDSGVAFRSSNNDTNPAAPISLVGAPFEGLPTLGTFTFTLQAASGDFDGNNVFDCADINALTTEIAAGTNNSDFDVSGDGVVNLADRDAWLAIADVTPFATGDINLDHAVDSTDLGRLLNNFSGSEDVGFCGGDIDANRMVDSTDLGLLLNSFGSGGGGDEFAAASAVVPEPHGLLSLLGGLGLILLGARRRR